MVSNIVGFFLIAIVVTLFMLFGEMLQWIFAPKANPPIRLSHALDKFFFQGGLPKHSTRHIEYVLLIHFLWMMLGNIILFGSSIFLKFNLSNLPLVGVFALFLGLWWAWRQGILK